MIGRLPLGIAIRLYPPQLPSLANHERFTPAAVLLAWERLTVDPRSRSERQHPLRGDLGTRVVNGQTIEQWQYEVTAGGRLGIRTDDDRRVVWLMDAMVGHPKATE